MRTASFEAGHMTAPNQVADLPFFPYTEAVVHTWAIDDQTNQVGVRPGGRRGAATRAWCNSTRARRPDVAPAQECGGAAAIARGRPGDRLARAGRHGSDADRLA